jgi:hypothetical protein
MTRLCKALYKKYSTQTYVINEIGKAQMLINLLGGVSVGLHDGL